ncbi:hypothetical protein BGZ68_007589 [Mortierella alpina]|nr:hypothetical protein BGZ68_007589 [Mortierella alpina]
MSTSDDSAVHAHHVIFVVHGMGRQLEEFGNYERNVSYLVENTKAVLQSQFHELKTDVHIIPIEWHAKLHSMVDERMALASLRTVPKVRLVMNDYFADILYYFNNHYGTEIIRMIVEELNEAYETFLAKHPDFNGKISVYALSLGGVAMFDILTCLDDDDEDTEQTETKGTEPKDQDPSRSDGQELNKKRQPRIRKQDQPKFRAVVPKLKFRPDYLFTVGSPVGAVMVMRNLDWETFHPPDDIIHHNLFHPFDPLGYRIEPLIDPVFAGIPAVTVTSYSNSQLFPSLSLPSLPSLLPMGTISSFWENRVPNLPRPSIPAFPTLTQMTQSLGAGRWLSGSTTGGNGLEEEGSGTNENAANSSGTSKNKEEGIPTEDSTTADEDNGEQNEGQGSKQHGKNDRDAMVVDGDASVTEYMIAATTATYLDQGEGASGSGSSRPADSETFKGTTTGSHAPATSSRRPSLGPRTISSRVEAGEDDQRQYQQTIPEAAEDGSSPLEMEYYLGMEGGPTAEEKARGLGAKSDVVQESMVRSLPSDSSCLPRSAKSPKDTDNPAENDFVLKRADGTVTEGESSKKQEGVTATSKTLSSPEGEAAAATSTTPQKGGKHSVGSSRVVHVEGRPTKVPYRVDHVLQESTVDQYTNEYLLGMRSHFRYWGNRDVAYHILRTMLQPTSTSENEGVLDLKLSMPTPVATSKGAKEAAESKAKATARSRSGTSGVADQETKRQNRMSFTFSFFGGQSDSTTPAASEEDLMREQQQRRHQEEVDEDFAMMDEEGELFGYRYSDLDMNHSANVSSLSKASSATLFQNSPFATSAYASDLNSTSNNADHGPRSSKRRISLQSAKSSGKTVTVATSSVAFEEGVVQVPDLARPAKLHHRSSRVEERQ